MGSSSEIGSDGGEHLDVDRELDKLTLNHNPEIHETLSQKANPVATGTNATAQVDILHPPSGLTDETGVGKAVISDAITFIGTVPGINAVDLSFPSVPSDPYLALHERNDQSPAVAVDHQPVTIATSTVDKQPATLLAVSQGETTFPVEIQEPPIASASDNLPSRVHDMQGMKDGLAPPAVAVPQNLNKEESQLSESPSEEIAEAAEEMLSQADGMEDFMEANSVGEMHAGVEGVEAFKDLGGVEASTEVWPQGIPLKNVSKVGKFLEDQQDIAATAHVVIRIEPSGTEFPDAGFPLVKTETGHERDDQAVEDVKNSAFLTVHFSESEDVQPADGEQTKLSEQDVGAFKGKKVLKRFGKEDFLGDIVGYDPETKWFKIVYEDGDEEELEKQEVETIVVSPGTLPDASRKRAHAGEHTKREYERISKKPKRAETPRKRGSLEGSKRKGQQTSGKKRGRPSGSKNMSRSSSTTSKSPGLKGKEPSKILSSTKKHKKSSGMQQGQVNSVKKQEVLNRPAKKGRNVVQKVKLLEKIELQLQKIPFKAQRTAINSQNKKHHREKKEVFTSKSSKELLAKAEEGIEKSSVGEPRSSYRKKMQIVEPALVQEKTSRGISGKNKSRRGRKLKLARISAKLQQGQAVETPKKLTVGVKRKTHFEENMDATAKRLRDGVTKSPKVQADLGGRIMRSKTGAGEVKVQKQEDYLRSDQAVGVALVGRLTRKRFGGVFYNGEVVGYDKKSKYYKVSYEDGDQEELEWKELEPTLISQEKTDISTNAISTEKISSSRPQSRKYKSVAPGGRNKHQ